MRDADVGVVPEQGSSLRIPEPLTTTKQTPLWGEELYKKGFVLDRYGAGNFTRILLKLSV